MGSSNRKIEDQVVYQPDGKLIWVLPRKKSLVGKECGGIRNGYLSMRVGNKTKLVHHVIWYLHHGSWPDYLFVIDHINQNKLDNKIENLRQVSKSVNALNNKAHNVSFTGKMWRVRIGQQYCGSYPTKEEAIIAASSLKQEVIKSLTKE